MELPQLPPNWKFDYVDACGYGWWFVKDEHGKVYMQSEDPVSCATVAWHVYELQESAKGTD